MFSYESGKNVSEHLFHKTPMNASVAYWWLSVLLYCNFWAEYNLFLFLVRRFIFYIGGMLAEQDNFSRNKSCKITCWIQVHNIAALVVSETVSRGFSENSFISKCLGKYFTWSRKNYIYYDNGVVRSSWKWSWNHVDKGPLL